MESPLYIFGGAGATVEFGEFLLPPVAGIKYKLYFIGIQASNAAGSTGGTVHLLGTNERNGQSYGITKAKLNPGVVNCVNQNVGFPRPVELKTGTGIKSLLYAADGVTQKAIADFESVSIQIHYTEVTQ